MEVVAAAAGGVFYMLMNHWANQNALRSPIVQDVVFLYSPFAWILVHVIPVSYTHLTLPTTPYV